MSKSNEKIESFGELIKRKRKEAKQPIREVAAFLGIDSAILSKIEHGKRRAKRDLVPKLAKYFNTDERKLTVAYLADQILYEIGDEEMGLEAMQLAERREEYRRFKLVNHSDLIKKLKAVVCRYPLVKKAWIFGSFSRGDDKPGSDIDMAIEAENGLSLFDLFEIQHQAELATKRKVDIGFLDSFDPDVLEKAKDDLKLIYAKRNK